MKTVRNLPQTKANEIKYASSNTVWISFSNPYEKDAPVENKILENLKTLKVSAWNLQEPFFFNEKWRMPPEKQEIEKIVDFLVAHSKSNVIVNCFGGKGRSGAVAKFCHDKMDYFWGEYGREIARPNLYIYNTMVNYFNLLNK
jgi:protein-tyrosine phosphatase